MSTIIIEPINEVYVRVYSDDMGVESELIQFFSFEYPGAKFTPRYKARLWDGKIYLYDGIRKTLYKGLIPYIETFANSRNYSLNNQVEESINNIEYETIDSFITSLNLHGKGSPIEARDYQIDAVHYALTNKRCILLSPTGSGKSLMIYSICRWMLERDLKCMVVVPTTSLVEQMYTDFCDYSSHNDFDVEENCQKLYSGFSKDFNSNILFTTWQSAYTLPKPWFDQFDCIIGDEAHQFKSGSLQKIMQRLDTLEYKIGTTGSLDDKKVHRLILEGIFGKLYSVTTTNKLQKDGSLAKLKIQALLLNYNQDICKAHKQDTYQEEIEFLISNEKRNRFISNIALKSNGTTLILFQFVEKHGKVLYDILKRKAPDRPIHLIHGGISTAEREDIRNSINPSENPIIVASYGVYSTGINIPSIETIIFASPSKSKIRNLQSIGRGLRLSDSKQHCTLYDIADNLSYNKHKNFTLKHGIERYKLYMEEKFQFNPVEVNI